MNVFKKFTRVSTLVVLLILLVASCDEYQSQEFEISNPDLKACNILADTLSDTLTTITLTTYDTTWADSILSHLPGILDSLGRDSVLVAIMDSLESDSIIVTDSDRSFTIITPSADADTNYAVLKTTRSALVFFANKSIDLNIIREDGTVKRFSNNKMPLETVAGCQVEVVSGQTKTKIPRIQTRLEFGISGTRSLLQIIKNDQTGTRIFNVAIL